MPPDIQYCVDTGVQLGKIGGDAAFFAYHFFPGVTEWFDENPLGDLNAAYEQHRENLSPLERAVCARAGVATAGDIIHTEMAPYAARLFLEHECARLQKTRRLTPKTRRRIDSDSRLRAFIPQSKIGRYLKLHDRLFARAAIDLAGFEERALARQADEIWQERQDARRAVMASLINSINSVGDGPRREIKALRKRKRKALVRASNFLATLVGPTETRAFIRGDGLIVQGQVYDFAIFNQNLRGSYGGWKIVLRDKQGNDLVDLCLFQEDVNTLDQVSSLIMMVQSGQENTLIETANFHHVYEAGATVDLPRPAKATAVWTEMEEFSADPSNIVAAEEYEGRDRWLPVGLFPWVPEDKVETVTQRTKNILCGRYAHLLRRLGTDEYHHLLTTCREPMIAF